MKLIVNTAVSVAGIPSPENDHHAARDQNWNFSDVSAVRKTITITATHVYHGHYVCIHKRWVAMWAK